MCEVKGILSWLWLGYLENLATDYETPMLADASTVTLTMSVRTQEV